MAAAAVLPPALARGAEAPLACAATPARAPEPCSDALDGSAFRSVSPRPAAPAASPDSSDASESSSEDEQGADAAAEAPHAPSLDTLASRPYSNRYISRQLPMDVLRAHFGLTMRQAAQRLGMGRTTFGHILRAQGVRWPRPASGSVRCTAAVHPHVARLAPIPEPDAKTDAEVEAPAAMPAAAEREATPPCEIAATRKAEPLADVRRRLLLKAAARFAMQPPLPLPPPLQQQPASLPASLAPPAIAVGPYPLPPGVRMPAFAGADAAACAHGGDCCEMLASPAAGAQGSSRGDAARKETSLSCSREHGASREEAGLPPACPPVSRCDGPPAMLAGAMLAAPACVPAASHRLPPGMRMPAFAVFANAVDGTSLTQVAAMLAELERCGWMREDGNGITGSAATRVAHFDPQAAAVEGLRMFVAEAAAGLVQPWHWSGAVILRCKRAHDTMYGGAGGDGRERGRLSSRSRSRLLPPGASMPRFGRGDDLPAVVAALRAAGWLCRAGLDEHTLRRLCADEAPEAAALALRRLPEAVAALPGVHVSNLAMRLCADAREELRAAQPRRRSHDKRRRSRSRSRSRGRSSGREAQREPALLPAATPSGCAASADAQPAGAPPVLPVPLQPPAPSAPPPPPPPPPPRFHYRAPDTREIVRAYPLSVFAGWLASGALPAQQAATLLVWRKGAAEDTAVPLSSLLGNAATNGGGT